jgi:hypothetical protein
VPLVIAEVRGLRSKVRRLSFHGNSHHLESAIQQQRRGAKKGARRKLPAKMFHVLGIKLIPECQISAKYLDPHKIVPPHACFSEDGRKIAEEKLDFPFHLGRSVPGGRINTNTSRNVERVVDEDGVTERQVGRTICEIDYATRRMGASRHP